MRVWVTRDELSGGPLSEALNNAGLTPVWEPVLERRVLDDGTEDISRLEFDDWLVLTSVYSVEAVALDPARVPRVAVVGDASAKAARERGLRVEHVGNSGANALFRDLSEMVGCGTVCYPRSSLAAPPEPWPGVTFTSPILYETVSRTFDTSVVDRVDVVAVASPSAVTAITDAGFVLRDDDASSGDRHDEKEISLPFASIGFTTTATLRRLGVEPWLESPQRSFESLAAAIATKAQR